MGEKRVGSFAGKDAADAVVVLTGGFLPGQQPFLFTITFIPRE
jgi:hypothetical protein